MNTNTTRTLSWMVFLAIGVTLLPAFGDESRGLPSLEEAIRAQANRTLAEALRNPKRLQPAEASTAWATKSLHFNCLPSCTEDDGRFLAIASDGLVTLSDPELRLHFAVPAGTTTFTLGIFDGDSAEIELSSGESRWDLGDPALFRYSLFKDPLADGSGTTPADLDPAPGVQSTVLSTSFPNNAWKDLTVTTDSGAQAPSGNFFYTLVAEFDSFIPPVGTTNLNALKVRTEGVVTVEVFEQPFSYIAAGLGALADILLIYPAFPSSNTPTSYDGTFTFFFERRAGDGADLRVFDGDFDRGDDFTLGLGNQDTDDPDTPDCEPPQPPPFGPGPGCSPPFFPFALTDDASPEGVAVGFLGSTGNPPDDIEPFGPLAFFVRTPTIRYDLLAPDGQTFANDNPSGNQEWEQFRIALPPLDSTMDYASPGLPFGIFRLEIEGVDMLNLNALRFPSRMLCVNAFGEVCQAFRPFLVGDTVFFDYDGDDVQDLPGEVGLAGVVVELIDFVSGELIATTTTDSSGKYSFEVDAATYTVRVAAANFGAGGALEGYVPTTVDQQTTTVVDENDLTLDFGYRGTGRVGDRVWNDPNGDGIQNDGATGINGVTVELLDAAGNLLDTTTTSGDGNYLFANLPAGTFTVRVVPSTLPAGAFATFDADGIGTLHLATFTLAIAEVNTGVDFGYAVCGACSGKVTRLTLQYLGTTAATVKVEAKRGPTTDQVFLGTVLPGGTFDLIGPASGSGGFAGTLGTEIRIFVNGSLHTTIHTSCSQPIGPGLISGSFKVVFGVSRDGGVLCPPGAGGGDPCDDDSDSDSDDSDSDDSDSDSDDSDSDSDGGACDDDDSDSDSDSDSDDGGSVACAPCDGKVTALTLRYRGFVSSAQVRVVDKDGRRAFEGVVQPGATFSFVGSDKNGTLGTEIRIYVNGFENTRMHTSCSQPIGPGLIRGDFEVIKGASRNGGELCRIGS